MKNLNYSNEVLTQCSGFLILKEKYLYFSQNILVFNKHIGH